MIIYFDRLINVYFFEWFFVFVESEKKKKIWWIIYFLVKIFVNFFLRMWILGLIKQVY